MSIRIPDDVRQYALERGVDVDLDQLDVDQDGEVSREDIDATVSTFDTVRHDGKLLGDERAALHTAMEKPALARNTIRANAAATARQGLGQLRDQMLVEVNDWARRAGDQLSDHHMSSLNAAQRFIAFARDKAVERQQEAIVAGSLVWALSINVPVNLAAVLIPHLANEGPSDLVAMQAKLVTEFERSLSKHRAAVNGLRHELCAQIRNAAGDPPALDRLQERIRAELATVNQTPSANAQLRDLVLAFAAREGLQVHGGPVVEEISGQYYVGYRDLMYDLTRAVDGTEVARFLNELAACDEELKQEVAINLSAADAERAARVIRSVPHTRV